MKFNLLTNKELRKTFHLYSIKFLNEIKKNLQHYSSQDLSYNHIKGIYNSLRKEMIKRKLTIVS